MPRRAIHPKGLVPPPPPGGEVWLRLTLTLAHSFPRNALGEVIANSLQSFAEAVNPSPSRAFGTLLFHDRSVAIATASGSRHTLARGLERLPRSGSLPH